MLTRRMASADLPDWPPPIGKPAARAVARAGINSRDDLSLWTVAEFAALHGVGPKALSILTADLMSAGLRFRPGY